MKILAIRGKNLASLEGEFEINFTTEPLKSAGIFAITGSTGSGKSTLLDALCLALFDETPRTHRATENSIQITDVKNKTINQKDSRNILRRGTSDGYAEVDFLSLGGEIFRSRWSVRRSRDKVDGALQGTEIKLINLSTNFEEQGTKTELLLKISMLIGLTFEQFTRAVLLAQGDFATFLKATQKEKAELLEKLTGTEIYSQISKLIYEKTKISEQELNHIRERIKDVELISDENIEILNAEKQTVIQEVERINNEIEILQAKIKWLVDESSLKEGIRQAEQQLTDAKKRIDEARSRYDYLNQVDQVQEIRDSFKELQTLNKQLAEHKSNLIYQEKLCAENELLLKKSTEDIAIQEDCFLQYNEKWEIVKPKIRQARELDIQIAGAKTNVQEAEKEYKQVGEKKMKFEKSITVLQASINAMTKQISELELWFNQNKNCKSVVKDVTLIINLLHDVDNAKKQNDNHSKILINNNSVLENKISELVELTEESERLNRLLPADIAKLREKLENGKPCPVCGSEHHPFSTIAGESLEEEKLNETKNIVAQKITDLSREIDTIKNENIRLMSNMESYTNISKETLDKLEHHLLDYQDWKAEFEKGSLQNSLQSLAETWSRNEENLHKANRDFGDSQTNLQLSQKQLIEITENFVLQEEKFKKLQSDFEKLQKERVNLFDGKSADEVENQYAKKGKELTDKLSKLKEEKNNYVVVGEKLKGIIKQVSEEITKFAEHSNSLQMAVNEWISSNNSDLTWELLTALLSKDNVWIVTEREQLNRLYQNRTTALATVEERKKTLANHYLSEIKPIEGEDKEFLQETLISKQALLQQKRARNVEIDVLFTNHHKGKERIALFEKELNEKSVLSENWKKLNDLLGSADGARFKVLAQGYTLDILLSYANKHLQELSKRYEIQRIADTLALQVVDMDMLGEIRTVHSLSGGESFLVSLALALGLSSLSSHKMKVESLFIDEGFGSLDIDTLRIAMDALERLQTQGRKIGVISHVAEMTERINTQIQVVKTVNGKSKVEIIG